MTRCAVVVALLFACGGEEKQLQEEVCGACTVDSDCANGWQCKQYGDMLFRCSPRCEAGMMATQECPAPALGQCNLMGFCMCPRKMDAGI